MAKEDKLKREIDLIGKLLAKLLSDLTGLNNGDGKDEVIQSIQQSLKDHLDLDLNVLLNTSQQEFDRILAGKKLSDVHLQYIADVINKIAELNSSGIQKKEFYRKALSLYEQLSSKDNSYSLDRHYKIEKIKKSL